MIESPSVFYSFDVGDNRFCLPVFSKVLQEIDCVKVDSLPQLMALLKAIPLLVTVRVRKSAKKPLWETTPTEPLSLPGPWRKGSFDEGQ